jgi:competence protein ComEA
MADLRERVLEWLEASPAELAGLALLLAGALVATLLVVRPPGPGDAAPAPLAVATAPTDAPTGAVTVHVVGEVARPGVVTLGLGARVRDAIAAAGGATSLARLETVNLARVVHDGEQLVVPGPEAAAPAGGTVDEAGEGGAIDADGRVDVNRATAEELTTLPGIGPVLAERILAHREANGPFTSPGELREVAGIGERTFQTLAELVVVR